MSIFDFISGPGINPNPNPQTPSLMDHLLSMTPNPAPVPQAPLQSQSPTTLSQVAPNLPDLWQPTHRSVIGRIADAMIMAHGGRPVYEPRMEQRDLTSALQGYDPNNPNPTIQRISQIPGMGEKALSLYQQAGTEQDRQQSRSIRDAAKKDLIFQRLGGMAGAATEQNFPAIQKLMTDYVKRWGENPDDYDIPQTYDRDALDALSGGSITAKDQQAEQARQQALALRGQAIENTDDYRQARLKQNDTAEADRNSRFNEGQDRTDRRHDNPVARPRSAPYVGKILKTPQGDMELSPSGLTGKIGDQIWQKTNGNQWTRIK